MKQQRKISKFSSRDTLISSVDLHGLTADQALALIEKTLSDALVKGSERLEIIHGLGSGKLKQVTHDYLRNSQHVRSFHLDIANPGATIAII